MDISEHQITVQGRNIHYYEAGAVYQPAVLLLQGYLGDAWLHWEKAMAALAEEGFYCIAPDLPGYGGSDSIKPLTLQALIQWSVDLLDALGIQQAALIGASFGGGLIARLAGVEQPARFTAVVLVNGGAIPAVSPIAKAISAIPLVGNLLFAQIAANVTGRSNLERLFQNQDNLTQERIERIQAQKRGVSRLMHALTRMAKPQKRVPMLPVLLVWGEEDAMVPRVIGEGIHQHLPGSKLELISDTRHLPHVETPDVFVWQVTMFLKRIAQQGNVDL